MQQPFRPREDDEARERRPERPREEEQPLAGEDEAPDEICDRSIGSFSDAQLAGKEDLTGRD